MTPLDAILSFPGVKNAIPLLATWGWLLHPACAVLVAFQCLQRRREPTSTLFWILLAAFLPVIGAMMFLLFGIYKLPVKGGHKRAADERLRDHRRAAVEDNRVEMAYWQAARNLHPAEPGDAAGREIHRALSGIVELEEYPLLGGNAILPLIDGDEAYPPMLEAIRQARHHIHLQSFIIHDDDTGRSFFAALAERARAGVTVRILYDRFGCTTAVWRWFFHRYRNVPNLTLVGWTQANPLKRQFVLNLRNHRKLLLVDGAVAFTGGVNLHDENLTRPGAPAIRDFHFQIRGPVVQELQYTFLQDWHFMSGEPPAQFLQPGYFPEQTPAGNALVRVLNGGPSFETEVMSDAFFSAITAARTRLWVITPYFSPLGDLIHALRAAAPRGVDVRLVLPEANNHLYAKLAGRATYEELLASGVRVFERRPPFVHAKAMIVDGSLAIIGTANLDVRSLRLNYETNLAVFDGAFVVVMKDVIEAELAASREILLPAWRNRPFLQQTLENAFNLCTPIL